MAVIFVYKLLFTFFFGHALHDTDLQGQTSIDPVVSSQERRGAVVPRINRVSLSSSIGLHGISCVRASEETFRTVAFDALVRKEDGCFLGGPSRRRPVLPFPAPPRRTAVRRPSPDPPVVCPGFGLDKYTLYSFMFLIYIYIYTYYVYAYTSVISNLLIHLFLDFDKIHYRIQNLSISL